MCFVIFWTYSLCHVSLYFVFLVGFILLLYFWFFLIFWFICVHLSLIVLISFTCLWLFTSSCSISWWAPVYLRVVLSLWLLFSVPMCSLCPSVLLIFVDSSCCYLLCFLFCFFFFYFPRFLVLGFSRFIQANCAFSSCWTWHVLLKMFRWANSLTTLIF